MGNIFVELPPPAYWQDFELMTLDICRTRWRDDYAELNGREGQEQAGVDVYGYNRGSNEHTGVQCKKRKQKVKGVIAPSSSLTTKEIDAEILAAASFRPPLDRFVIATTAPRHANLQAYVRELNGKQPKIPLSLWFWDDYVEFLNADKNLMYRYYSNVLKYRERYSEDEHLLRLLALAFDRPAIRTPFHLENRAVDFLEAISSLQQLISTGVLSNRDGHVIDQARLPAKVPPQIKLIRMLLLKIRTVATEALKDGTIVDHGTVIEIRRPRLQMELNDLRKEVVAQLNQLLIVANIDPLEIRDY